MGIFSSFRKKGVEPPKVDGQSADKAVSPRSFIAGRYQIYRILGGPGKSGMGIVYVCLDHEGKEVVALKTFQDKYLTSKEARDSFRREALLWVMLDRHPYIVRAFWVQELDYRLFVACEFVAPDDEGRNTLTHHLRQPISLKQALIWSIQFCYGMEYAVSKGVTPHRDIKPDNIMITRDGMLKITDFGLAGMWQGEGMSKGLKEMAGGEHRGFTFFELEGEKVGCGTPPWMAPEQFDGAADVRSDVYSFGVVLYQMASGGRLPFVPPYPRNNSKEEVKRFWREMRELHSTSVVSRLSSPISPIMGRCLEKDPGNRYAGFRELRSDLEAVYEEEITRKTGEKLPSQPEMTELGARELNNKGVSLYHLGLRDEAIRACREAIRIRPEYAEAHSNLGIALEAKGDLDGAIKEYREAIRIRPEYAEAHSNLGIALTDKRDLDGAIKECREALSIRPDFAEAHHNMGNALYAKGDLDGAIEEYREAIKIRPNHAKAHYNLGNALSDKRDLDGAIEEYREAIKIRPDIAEDHYNLGVALGAKANFDEAIGEFQVALRLRPEFAEAYCNLGNALAAKGNLDGAIRAFEHFIRYAPSQYAGQVEKVKQVTAQLKQQM
jgi:serine/threonine protein kinase/TolA-binding protein